MSIIRENICMVQAILKLTSWKLSPTFTVSHPHPPSKYMLSVAKIGRYVADFFVSHHVVKL